MKMKGWLALDIDGTLTVEKHTIPREVSDFLRARVQEGWGIAVATGRTFSFSEKALADFDFPFIFLAQNGSLALSMPEQKILFKRYLSPHLIPLAERAYEGIDSDFIIYAGLEKGDICYWRPSRFSGEELRYLEDLQLRQKEEWEVIGNFQSQILDPFPLIKCFGNAPRMKKVAERLKKTGQFQVTQLQDPFDGLFTLLLVTDKTASKGDSLREIFKQMGRGERVIAAGDDENDLSLLQAADVKIAMARAPLVLQQEADLIAHQGIIQALQMALRL
jgi:hypothetical protein